jgi:iron complex outermembrane recepter protein
MKNRDICPWGLPASVVAPAIAVGLSMASSSAPAQTVLPDINVIAPTPLSGHRPAKPSNAPAAPTPPTGAPAEPAPAVTTGDPTLIDRDKVPSNTSVLTSADFSL